jgi:hypothetical protein
MKYLIPVSAFSPPISYTATEFLFASRDWGNPRKTSGGVLGVMAEIEKEELEELPIGPVCKLTQKYIKKR